MEVELDKRGKFVVVKLGAAHVYNVKRLSKLQLVGAVFQELSCFSLRNTGTHVVSSESLAFTQTVVDRNLTFDLRRPRELEQRVTELFTVLHRPVLRYVLSILADRGIAEDVTQDVFLRLYLSLRRGEEIVHLRAWVFQVAYRLTVDTIRAKRKVEFLQDDEAMLVLETQPAINSNPEEKLLEQEQRDEVQAAWYRLSPQERNCLNLRAEGLSYGEIASVLGIRSSSVSNFLARGICKIRKTLT